MSMKRVLFCILLFVIGLFGAVPAPGAEPDARAIIARAWDYMRGTTSVSILHMTVHRAEWERKTTIKVWTKGRENSIFRIVSPKKDKGNGTLKLGQDMWTYNPKINRVVKIPPSMMSQSWMGSDFSNNDLSKADSILNDYTHEMAGTKRDGSFTVYEIRSVPRPQAPVVWGMQVLKIREDGVLMAQVFYDEDLEPVKELITKEIADLGGRPFPLKWIMRSMDAESEEDYTQLLYESIEFDTSLRDSLFTLNALKRPMR